MSAAGGPAIRLAETAEDFNAFGAICRDYVGWCRRRFADMPWFVEEVFGHQSLDAELADLPAKYGPPAGRTMIAHGPDGVVAGGAYRRIDAATCELKRLYVRDAAAGSGIGRRLTRALIEGARADGYATMRLDTAARFVEAVGLYETMGFVRIAPYLDYPARLLPHLVFMELPL